MIGRKCVLHVLQMLYTSQDVKQYVMNILNINEKEDMSLHLGIPLLQGRSRKRSYNFVLDNVKLRLSGWKRRCLSVVGIIVLAKSI